MQKADTQFRIIIKHLKLWKTGKKYIPRWAVTTNLSVIYIILNSRTR